jgi:hypothetical protein
MPEILDQHVIFQNGPHQRVRRWWRGVRPEKGTIIWGLTGWETVEEIDRFVPAHTFVVEAARRRAA